MSVYGQEDRRKVWASDDDLVMALSAVDSALRDGDLSRLRDARDVLQLIYVDLTEGND